ncbi:hypothetical protein AVEN_88213-1 [Araneus ventricosus]|uniref:Reverse transcriptase domain-containing protein n=1 Tax=Araneus ventricosus TaxID=182803 RepID=A0A4Y2HWU9_ARAVE|nr:hypothetical protein AVEN_88213-1 [Araneus ventricosus]
MVRKLSKKYSKISPILGSRGLAFSIVDKANAFAYNLEETFQENAEPYDDAHIEMVEEEVKDFLSSPTQSTVTKLASPLEIDKIIGKLNIRMASGPDKIPVKALKLITPNVLTSMTKIFNKCLKFHHFPIHGN